MEYVKKIKFLKNWTARAHTGLNSKTMVTQLKDVRHHLAWTKICDSELDPL